MCDGKSRGTGATAERTCTSGVNKQQSHGSISCMCCSSTTSFHFVRASISRPTSTVAEIPAMLEGVSDDHDCQGGLLVISRVLDSSAAPSDGCSATRTNGSCVTMCNLMFPPVGRTGPRWVLTARSPTSLDSSRARAAKPRFGTHARTFQQCYWCHMHFPVECMEPSTHCPAVEKMILCPASTSLRDTESLSCVSSLCPRGCHAERDSAAW